MRSANAHVTGLNGNTLSGGGRTNTWDSQNRLVQCVNGVTTSTFTYGPDGLRRSSTTGGVTTNSVLEGQSVVREAQTSNNSTVYTNTYLSGPRGPEYQRDQNGNVAWYLYDGLGSVVGTVDATGTLGSVRKYDVYGAVRGLNGGSGTKHKFVGGLGHPSEDVTGLIYMRARYYDPVTGRFESEDPAVQGTNWYGYGLGNPVNLVDSNGCEAHHPSIEPGDALISLGSYMLAVSLMPLGNALAWNLQLIKDTIGYYRSGDNRLLKSYHFMNMAVSATQAKRELISAVYLILTGHHLILEGQMLNIEASSA